MMSCDTQVVLTQKLVQKFERSGGIWKLEVLIKVHVTSLWCINQTQISVNLGAFSIYEVTQFKIRVYIYKTVQNKYCREVWRCVDKSEC
jgi:hypothetical protein